MPAPAWRDSLGFADRLAVVTKIQASLQDAESTLTRAEASRLAQQDETACLNAAASQADYVQLWTERLAEIQSQASKQKQEGPLEKDTESHGLSAAEPTLRIGPYTTQPFACGLTSTIYKAIPDEHVTLESTVSPSDGVNNTTATTSTSPSTKLVALKVTTPHLLTAPHDSTQESRILKSLHGTPHILPLLSTFTPADSPTTHVLVTLFLPYTLASLLSAPATSQHALTPARIRRILHDIFAGLAALHVAGILHRDIKPSNILLSSASAPAYIGDFGIAWAPASVSAHPEPADSKVTDVGTTCYRAPELLFGFREYGVGVDLWAAGCVAFECFHPRHQPLFDAGDLGSDLKLVGNILEILGTPNENSWPSRRFCPDWGKLCFEDKAGQTWDEVLPLEGIYENERVRMRALVDALVRYEWGNRMSAEKVLELPYFTEEG